MRRIAILSGKGGVGKTTTSVNLGIALSQLGKNTTLMDANFTTPDVAMHVGIPMGTPTLHHVLAGTSMLKHAIHLHYSGLKIIPASTAFNDIKRARYEKFGDVVGLVDGDFVLMDCGAGLGRDVERVVENADETLIVTNPEWPAITNALKCIMISEQMGVPVIGVILNRVKYAQLEPAIKQVEAILDKPIIAVVPEDDSVRLGIVTKNPLVISSPDSDAAHAYKKLAADMSGVPYRPPRKSIFSHIMKLLRKTV
jgi:septum site-determining protein MinD